MSVQDRPGRRQAFIVEFEATPAYEFLMSLCAFSDAANYTSFDIGKAWFDDVRKKASPDLIATVEQFSFHSYEVWEHMLGLVYDCPTPKMYQHSLRLLKRQIRWNCVCTCWDTMSGHTVEPRHPKSFCRRRKVI